MHDPEAVGDQCISCHLVAHSGGADCTTCHGNFHSEGPFVDAVIPVVDSVPDPPPPAATTSTDPPITDRGPHPDTAMEEIDDRSVGETEAASRFPWPAVWIFALGVLIAIGVARREDLRRLFGGGA
ncbi:MAG: hypothetical protein HKN80_01820 [Acidimicrobiia bacterium]|nr:hypothetical protein [Acidimicrobiia bacterium]